MRFFENRKVKGAISIFLVIILIPTMLFAAVLIDGGRMVSARAITQEAADLAASSALAAYDMDLKNKYGLFAIEDNSKVEEIYKKSLSATLMAYGLEDQSYSEQAWELLKSQVGMGNPYQGQEFLNLYDFAVEDCKVEPMYSLAEWQVLENQMVEYAKFRGIYVMADRFDLLAKIDESKKQAQKNKDTSEVMEDKMDVDEDNADVEPTMEELRTAISELNKTIGNVDTYKEDYLSALKAEMEKIRLENIDTEEEISDATLQKAKTYNSSRQKLKTEVGVLPKKADEVLKKAEKAGKAVEKAISRLENFKSSNSQKTSDNEDVKALIDDASENIRQYKEGYLPAIKKIKDDTVINKLKSDSGLANQTDQVMDQIDDAIRKYIEKIEEMREAAEADSEDEDSEESNSEKEEITEYFYYYLNSTSASSEYANEVLEGGSTERYYRGAIEKKFSYFKGKKWEEINPSVESSEQKKGNKNKIDKTFAENQSKSSSEDKEDSGAKRGEVETAIYQALPSRSKVPSESGKSGGSGFYNTSGDLTKSKDIMSNGKNSMILDLAEAARDDVLCLSYMFGTFKTRLTGIEKFSSANMPQKEKDSFYMPKWRCSHENGEVDMRFTPKKDRDTVLRGEIEYLVYGNRTDAGNEDAVYATIMAERLANNMIACYQERKLVNPSCHEAAALASLATAGIIPEPVFFWIFLTAWATAETVIEMNYLAKDGYKVPLFKTKDNILLTIHADENDADFNLSDSSDNSGFQLINHYGTSGVFVSYEDYLLILLLLKGEQKRLMRSADLVEMNMKKADGEFTMDKAYTYLKADTDLSLRYLFGSTTPFQEEYQKSGATGRMRFTNTIYQGY